MSDWRKFRDLSWTDRRLLLQAAVLLVCARLSLRFIDLRVDTGAAAHPAAMSPPAADLGRAKAIARLVGIASGHIPLAVTCLHRSLALWWLLRRNGIRCELRLGARAGADPFGAHAWVECAGVALNEDGANLATVPRRSPRPLSRSVPGDGGGLQWPHERHRRHHPFRRCPGKRRDWLRR